MRRLTFAIATAVGIVASAACASRSPPPPPAQPDPVQACRGSCLENCAVHESEWYPGCAMGCDKRCERGGFAALGLTFDLDGGRREGG